MRKHLYLKTSTSESKKVRQRSVTNMSCEMQKSWKKLIWQIWAVQIVANCLERSVITSFLTWPSGPIAFAAVSVVHRLNKSEMSQWKNLSHFLLQQELLQIQQKQWLLTNPMHFKVFWVQWNSFHMSKCIHASRTRKCYIFSFANKYKYVSKPGK